MSWHGTVKLAGRKATRTYHVARGAYVSLPENTVPPWAIALMVIGGLMLISATVLGLRRRPAGKAGRRPAGAGGQGPARGAARRGRSRRSARNRPAT